MSVADRRVRRVRLAAPDPALVRRGAVLLEDALRTASLGGDGGRLVLVRRLDVGRIRPRGAPSSVALALEHWMRHAAAFSVWALDPSSASADAVWFRDAVEAHAALALRISTGRGAGEWFWRLAVSRWRPEMSRDEALRAILGSAAESAPGAFAAVAVLAELVERGAAGPLLDALRWQDGPALLRACGWSAPSSPVRLLRTPVLVVSDGSSETVQPSPETLVDETPAAASALARDMGARWTALIASQARAWGEDDARTHWLAAAALVTASPSRALDPRLADRAARLVAAALDEESPRIQPRQPRSSGDDHPAAALVHRDRRSADHPEDAASPRSATPDLSRDDADPHAQSYSIDRSVAAVAGAAPPPSIEPVAPAQIIDRAADASPVTAAISPRLSSPGSASDDAAEQTTRAREIDARDSIDRHRTEAVGQPRPGDDELAATQSISPVPPRPESAIDGTVDDSFLDRVAGGAEGAEGLSVAKSQLADAVDPPAPPKPRFPDTPVATAGGGLVFLIPILQRLGIAEMVRDAAWLADAAFPARLLRHIALRAGIPARDPILAAFGADGDLPLTPGEAWCAPQAWSRGITADGPCIVRAMADGGRVVFDASGRLPLAAWYGANIPAGAETWLAGAVESSSPLSHSRTLALSHSLLSAGTTAARRYARRGAKMGLSTLVHRPARVLFTRTHVDVVFDHRDADVRVRRAGLDMDPGWVPWLGRVVQIHYLYGERPERDTKGSASPSPQPFGGKEGAAAADESHV